MVLQYVLHILSDISYIFIHFHIILLYVALAMMLSRCFSGNLWSSADEVHLRAAIDRGRLGAFPRGDGGQVLGAGHPLDEKPWLGVLLDGNGC